VDLYVENTVRRSRLVLLRLLGGAGYWSYGLDRLIETARGHGLSLVVVPGDDRWDPDLAARSTVGLEAAERLWRYCVEGGAGNLANALRFAAHLIGSAEEPEPPRPLPRAGLFMPGQTAPDLDAIRQTWGDPGAPVAAIVFYRALVYGAATAPIEALAEALAREGVNALPIFVASLKEAESAAVIDALFEACPPDVVINATAFAVSSAGRSHRPTVLDRPGVPVLQAVFSSSSEDGWRDSDQGLGPRDLAMHVVLPEVDGRIFTRAVSFKEEGVRDQATQSVPVRFVPKPDRIAFVAALASNWSRLRRTPDAQRRVAIVLSNYPNQDE